MTFVTSQMSVEDKSIQLKEW